MTRRRIYNSELLSMARKLGREGFAVTEAAEKMGISPATFIRWEREIPAFRKATAKIRENSDRWKAYRFARLLGRTEEQLLAALARVREKKAEEIRKYHERFGPNNSV